MLYKGLHGLATRKKAKMIFLSWLKKVQVVIRCDIVQIQKIEY